MKVAALLGPRASVASLQPFQHEGVEFTIGLPPEAALDAVLIFGGDGTVHRHLPYLNANKIAFLVVPKGSGNDFAHALSIHSERAALRAWRQFCADGTNVREVDLGLICKDDLEIPFCCVVGAGLDAQANARANQMPSWLRRSAGYLIAAIQALLSFRPVEVEVTTEVRRERQLVTLIAVGNAHRYGGGVKIVPRAALDDGLLDVCVVGKISKLKVLFCLPIIYFGGHTRLKEVDYFQARTVRIEADQALELYADGELVSSTPVEISLVPRALRVIVPAGRVLDSSSRNRS